MGGLRIREGLAIGIGLNVCGALEIVVATVGLALGVLNSTSYTVVVAMAMANSIMAPPLLRVVLCGLRADPDEQARLEHEAMLEGSVIARVENALLPTRGVQLGAGGAAARPGVPGRHRGDDLHRTPGPADESSAR